MELKIESIKIEIDSSEYYVLLSLYDFLLMQNIDFDKTDIYIHNVDVLIGIKRITIISTVDEDFKIKLLKFLEELKFDPTLTKITGDKLVF